MPRPRKANRRRPSSISRRGRKMAGPLGRRLGFETLEDRLMLAVVTVDYALDVVNGDTSSIVNLIASDGGDGIALREALDAANNTLGADTVAFDPVVFATPQTILLGLGEIDISEAVTIDGPGQQLLTIDAQQNSRIFNITATTGDFTLAGLTLTGGRTMVDFLLGSGGAIRSQTTGSLTIDHSTVSGNNTAGSSADGGGIRSISYSGTVTLTGSSVSGNSTMGEFSRGGGIFADGVVTLTQSTVSGNSTAESSADGGGIFSFGNVALTQSTVSGNSTAGNNSDGGGIFTFATLGNVTLTDSTVSGNSTAGLIADGGGIYSRGYVTLNHSTVSGNSTAGDNAYGGGIYSIRTVTLNQSTVSGNSTAGFGAYGGGIYSQGAVTLTDSTVSGNSTAETFARGGGIYSQGAVTLTDSTVSGNSTGGIGADGGGISSQGTVTLNSSTVSGNYTTADSADGGGIFSLFAVPLTDSAVMLTDSTVSGNSTAGNSADGGGIYSKGDVTLLHSTIADNHANHTNAFGGGIWNDNDLVIITNSIVAGNTAGGGMNDIRPGTGPLIINYSLIQQSGLGIGGSGGNILGEPANLGPLASNGGPTKTHSLLAGSKAIDAGDPGIVPNPAEFDQRGAPFVRVFDDPAAVGTGIDMGAYERQSVAGLNLVVDTPVDENDGDYSAGDLSLREAVGLANGSIGANTITFDAAVFDTPQTILLGLGEIGISEAVMIDGPGAHLLTIDAQQQSRIFNITATTGDFTLAGLTLADGQTIVDSALGRGGAIRSLTSGSLTIDQSTVSGNRTTGNYARGGGIYSSGPVTLTGSTVSGNNTSGTSSLGGGIYSTGVVMLIDSTVSGNSTAGTFASGGGIFASDHVTLAGSTVSGNSTAGSNAKGGGIFSHGIPSNGNVTLTQSTVSGNSTSGSNAYGGGIRTSGNVTLTHSTFTANHAYDVNATGGGIWNNDDPIVITNSIVAGNTAGGGMNDIRPGTGSLNIDFSLIEQTGLTITGSGNIIGMPANLGALTNNGGPTETHALLPGSPAIDAGGTTTLVNDQRGAPFVRIFDDPAAVGTGIDMGAYERQTVDGLYFIVDTLVDDDNGNYTAGDRSLREVIRIVSGSVGADTINFDAALTGGTIFLSLGHLSITSDVTLAGLGADMLAIDAQGASSVIRIFDSATVDISGLTLTGGRDHRGGGIWNSNGGTVNVANSTISGNSATSGGGAIYNRHGVATVTNSTISGNVAVGSSGGAIGNGTGGTVTVTGSTISGNSAERGGGILNSGTVTIINSTISGNTATEAGGGISNAGFGGIGVVTITNSTISGNTAERGGGVYNTGTATITSSTISGNAATNDGGGIYNTGTAHITHSIVAGNMAGTDMDVSGSLDTDTFNLIGGDPMLGPLGDNGGPTETHALLVGSPAIDAGDPAILFSPTEFDQRGAPFRRVVGAGIDIGAFELQPAPALPGDYNQNGVVDAADYVLWRKDPAAYGGVPDGYNTWRENLGETLSAGSGSAASPPALEESTSVTLAPPPAAATEDPRVSSRTFDFLDRLNPTATRTAALDVPSARPNRGFKRTTLNIATPPSLLLVLSEARSAQRPTVDPPERLHRDAAIEAISEEWESGIDELSSGGAILTLATAAVEELQ